MIQEILAVASKVKNPNKTIIQSNHLKKNRASLTEALCRVRYLLYDMAIDLGVEKEVGVDYKEIGDRLEREIFCSGEET